MKKVGCAARWMLAGAALVAWSCGGSEAPKDHRSELLEQLSSGDEHGGLPPEAPEVTSEEEPSPSAALEMDQESAAETPAPEEARASGPARVTVKVLLDGEELPIRVRVLRMPSGELVYEVRSGTVVRLEPGSYALEASIRDESVLIDKPTKRSEPFTVGPGEERVEELEFGRSRVKLRVFRGRRRIRKGKIVLRRAGSDEVVVELPISDATITISPGRYDATVRFGREQIDVSGLTFQAGAEQVVPIRIR